MGWRTTGDVAEFLAAAGDFLRGERARNTVFLTVTETMRANPGQYRGNPDAGPAGLPLFGWWSRGEGTGAKAAVRGAFLHTPPFPVLLSAVPAAAAVSLARDTLAGRPMSGVNAYPETATAFGGAWREMTGGQVGAHTLTRLYRLAELSWPDPLPDGAPRLAAQGDAALLTDWFAAFTREVSPPGAADASDPSAAVAERLSYLGVTLWEADGEAVSLAGVTRQVAGMVRIGPVYTPPDRRGHGYGTAVTAAVSQRVLAAGAEEVLLYTDLANPVSNSIYQRIGYRPVEDRVMLSFTPLGSAP
jgi:GNAT superfamily N-acetyltransferase